MKQRILDEELLSCSVFGDLQGVKRCVSFGANVNVNDITFNDKYQWSPLIHASFNGHLHIVKFLVEKGANINYENQYYCTAIDRAASHNIIDVVKYLLLCKANITMTDIYSNTCFNFGDCWKYYEIQKLICERYTNGINILIKNKVGLHKYIKQEYIEAISDELGFFD